MSDDTRKPLGRILVRHRAITQPDLDRALSDSPGSSVPLASRLTESGAISEVEALKALSEQSGVPGIDLNQICIRLADIAILPREIALRHKLLPVLARGDRIFVAMASPNDKKVIDELEFVTGKRVFPYVALAGLLGRVISAAYELYERGQAYYVGSRCPPEILRKTGITIGEARPAPLPDELAAQPRRLGAPSAPAVATGPEASDSDAAEQLFRPTRGKGTTLASTPVVVDDQLDAAAAADELGDSDFGSADASVVTAPPAGPAVRTSSDAEALLGAAIAAYQAGDIVGAIEKLREGTRVDPLAQRLHFHLGLLHAKHGDLYDAIQELETALDLNPTHFPALRNLALLYQKTGFRNKATDAWERALAAAPDGPTRQSAAEHLLGLL